MRTLSRIFIRFRKTPIGFCIADVNSEIKDVAEFYIIPVVCKKKFGYRFAAEIFDKFPGRWQVNRIEGASMVYIAGELS